MEISIIIPTYNREEFVINTLDSVLKQTYRPIHLVLVDNNSTDNTLSLLNSFKESNEDSTFKITVLKEERQGASFARNKGLECATSEWVLFFDSDDTMENYHVEQCVETINNKSNQCDIIIFRSDFNFVNGKRRLTALRSGDLFRNHIYHSILSTQRYIVKREFFIEAGKWNEDLLLWDDWELGIRLLLNKPRVESIVDNVPVHIFVHNDSITGHNYSSRSQSIALAVDAAFEAVQNSNNISQDEKDKLITLLEFKRLTLAGLYTKEKSPLGRKLYKEVLKRTKGKTACRIFFPYIYHYIALGGRGSAKIIDLLV